ncbi:MAG: hypothetical protein ACLQK8_14850, partial [Streptosporangiaceae bacterium]
EAEEKLTSGMEEVERENACGGWLAGKEFRLKGEERLKEKIADSLAIAPVLSPQDLVREVPDVVRYTFCFESTAYVEGYWDIKERLEARGHQMVYSKNHWPDDPEYKGVNTRWLTAAGQRFELQFHGPESFHAKQQVTHGSYERIRNPLTGRGERHELEAFQRDVCTWIPVPEKAVGIPDYRESS